MPQICNNNGKCLLKKNKISCQCHSGYQGKYCEIWHCKNDCNKNGYCMGPNRCKCITPYIGNLCENYPCFLSQKNCQCHRSYLAGKNCNEIVCPNKCIFGTCVLIRNVKLYYIYTN
ncbi:hypothetical protein HZS_140 [Henneguya salminicola]|nr:hypothetical protein HZS_140 [Henneguya salminicola]